MSFWDEQALPVLAAIADSSDGHLRAGFLQVGRGRAARTLALELSDAHVYQALLALNDAGYVQWRQMHLQTGPGAAFSGLAITGAGQQALGQWPYFELFTNPQTLAMVFEALADLVPADERSALLRARDKSLELTHDAATAVVIGVAGQAARAALGLP